MPNSDEYSPKDKFIDWIRWQALLKAHDKKQKRNVKIQKWILRILIMSIVILIFQYCR